MGNNKESLRWLLSELPKLRQSGVLDETAAESLTKYCHGELDLKPPPSRFIYTLFYIGMGMIAAGVVLFFNYNWDCLTKYQRLGVSALPMAVAFISAMITILGQKSQLWREFTAVFTAAATATLVAMVSRIYHVNGSLSAYMTLVLALSLPFIYIFNSVALSTLYSFGLFMMLWGKDAPPLHCFAAAFAILPMLHIQISRGNPNRVWARYLMIVVAVFGVVSCIGGGYPPLALFSLAGTMIYAGWALSERHESTLRNPWLFTSFVFMLVLLGVASSSVSFFNPTEPKPVQDVWAYWLFTGVVLATNIRLFPKSRLDAKRLTTGLLVLLPLLHFCKVDAPTMKLIFNIYMGVYGAVLMLDGFRRGRLLTYNGGVAMVLLLIVCRFFDSELGLLTRSIAFIAVGVALIVANSIFFRSRFKEGR